MTDKIQNRLNALKAKHSELDRLINEEMARPNPNDTQIHEWKKQKLKAKEEIAEIEAK